MHKTISTENKIKKIASAIPLITKFALGPANTYHDDKHIYKTLTKISSLLKVGASFLGSLTHLLFNTLYSAVDVVT